MQLRTDPLTGLRVRTAVDEPPPPEASPDLFGAAIDDAVTEVLDHPPLDALDAAGTRAALMRWRERIAAQDAACVHVAANAGAPGATLTALPRVPAAIARERERFAAHAVRTGGGNLLGELVQEEVRRRERLVHYDDEVVVLAAYAPRVPHQLLIVPRRPVPRFEADGPLGAAGLHDALGRLRRLRGADAPAPFVWVRTAPAGADAFCWRIDVLGPPVPDGLELGTGLAQTAVSPEAAAAALRAV